MNNTSRWSQYALSEEEQKSENQKKIQSIQKETAESQSPDFRNKKKDWSQYASEGTTDEEAKKLLPEFKPLDLEEAVKLQQTNPDEYKKYMEDYKKYQSDFNQSLIRGFNSGATFGATGYLPGGESTGGPGEFGGELLGSVIPITAQSAFVNWIAKPAWNLIKATPYIGKGLGALQNITNTALTGASYAGLEGAIHPDKVIDSDHMIDSAFQWSLIHGTLSTAGYLGKFGYKLLKAYGKSGQDIPNAAMKEFNSLSMDNLIAGGSKAQKEMDKLISMPRSAQKGAPRQVSVKKGGIERTPRLQEPIEINTSKTAPPSKEISVTYNPLQKIGDDAATLAEPVAKSPANAEFVIENNNKALLEGEMDQFAPKAQDELQLGDNVKNDLKLQREAASKTYTPLYNIARDVSKNVQATAPNVAQKALFLINELKAIGTKTEGQEKLISQFERVIDDAGYAIIPQGKVVGNKMTFGKKSILVKKNGPGANVGEELMPLKQRIGDHVNYDAMESNVRDRWRDLQGAIRQDIRASLKDHPEALESWNKAESVYAQTAEKFGKDSIIKMRTTEKGEQIAKMVESPSTIRDVREVVSPGQMKQIERQILDKIMDNKLDKAQKLFNGLRRQLSQEAQSLGEKILESKRPLPENMRLQKIGNKIYDNLMNAVSTNNRPKYVLDLWGTKPGQKIVNDVLENDANKHEIIDYLRKQTLYDHAQTVVKDGKLDYTALRHKLSDPMFKENIIQLSGKEGLDFFKKLEMVSNKVKSNADQVISQFEPHKRLLKEKGKLITGNPKGEFKKVNELPEVRQGRDITRKGQEALLKPKAEVKPERIQQVKERFAKAQQEAFEKQHPFLSKAEKTKEKVNSFLEFIGTKPATLLSFLGYSSMGIPGVIGVPLLSKAAPNMIYKMATNPRLRYVIKEAGKGKLPVFVFLPLLIRAGDLANEDEQEE